MPQTFTPAPDNPKRLDELFDGRTCARYGAEADRLSGGRFFCVAHFLRYTPREATPPRVYWCGSVDH